MSTDAICDDLRIKPLRLVKTGRVDRDQFRHGGECQVNWRSAGGAECVYFLVPAVAPNAPAFCRARDCHVGAPRERQIGPMPGPAAFLAIAALAVIFEDRFACGFIADGTTGAAAGIGFGHDDAFLE